ncbi:dihydropteroate synthase [uncultured Parolsenella sp.]|uniref:dihydropteroate synthase n=1 Tax=uncultured Parolsenella sp. TaxID=2083008 RepID=UPI0027DCEB72|nr:dihydropteroate synthase [uncultured Parolsenella sp.]
MLREDLATWHCGKHNISLARPRIMGVLNVTPDSFSDGGAHADTDAAIEWGLKLLDDGADIIDVGGESTRPGFRPVSPDEEAKRVIPVIRALVDAGAVVSIDTRHPEVARLAVKLGASIVNDVTGFTNPEMVRVAVESDCGCVVMHAGEVSGRTARRSVTLDSSAAARAAAAHAKDAAPAKDADEPEKPAEPSSADVADAAAAERLDEVMRRSARGVTSPTVTLAGGNRRFTLPESAPIMRHVMGFLGDQARELMRAGVSRERICIDPGPGFGKLADEDVVIQRANAKMVSMGYPVMCAVSRKRFVGAVSGVTDAAARDAATAGVCIAAVESGVRLLRVHDVAGVAQALNSYWSVAHPDPRRAFVALGSNVGDRLEYLKRAAALINAIPLTCVTAVSRAYETDPAYGIAMPVANAAAEIRTELAPLVLIDALLDVEKKLGRTRPAGQEGHGPRTIDCDLLWMEGESHAGRKLALPHPRLGERDFVIVPMEDLMHDPERFLAHAGISVLPREQRVGLVRADLGELAWE